MQIQADYLGRRIVRPRIIETTVAGASYLAGLGVGLWRSTADIKRIWQPESEFHVSMKPAARRRRRDSWQRAIRQTLSAA
jgi:glycerol kinase